MIKEIEVRFATKTYEFINVKFDAIPTIEEYKAAKYFAEVHKTYREVLPEETLDMTPPKE